MTQPLQSMTVTELVERFVAIGLEQDKAELHGDTKRFKPLYLRKVAILEELKSRPGDQREALVSLHAHPNMQVRLNAAKATLAIAPAAARETLRAIVASRHFPQAGDAGMSLRNLDDGVFKPT